MNCHCVFLLLLSCAAQFLPESALSDYESAYNRVYSSGERARRGEVLKEKLELIERHNADRKATFRMAVNKFSDRSEEELSAMVMQTNLCGGSPNFNLSKAEAMPDNFDWRTYGIVTPVRNQGNCGASWAISAASAVESHWAIINNSTAPVLSPQQLIDCSADFLNSGCEGGLPAQAFEYIQYANFITSEETYPYVGTQHQCWANLTMAAQVPLGSINITAGNEIGLQQAICYSGPVSVVFSITSDFFHYSSGIYSNSNCVSTLSHSALIVGYASDSVSGLPYWIAKNSWGSDWGQGGYFYILRGNNTCGVANCAAYPNIESYSLPQA